MLTAKTQTAYLQAHIAKAIYYLQLFCKRDNAEHLHKLRVEIKKIKSLIRFVGDCSKRSWRKELKPMQVIFHHGARIRNTHIHLKLTRSNAGKKFSKNQLALAKKEWQQYADKGPLYAIQIQKLQEELLPRLKNTKRKKADKWFKSQIKKAGTKLDEGPHQFHEARKIIKRLLHISDLHTSRPALNNVYLKKLETDIGNWHDITETMQVLKRQKTFTGKLKETLLIKSERLNNQLTSRADNFKEKAKK